MPTAHSLIAVYLQLLLPFICCLKSQLNRQTTFCKGVPNLAARNGSDRLGPLDHFCYQILHDAPSPVLVLTLWSDDFFLWGVQSPWQSYSDPCTRVHNTTGLGLRPTQWLTSMFGIISIAVLSIFGVYVNNPRPIMVPCWLYCGNFAIPYPEAITWSGSD